MAAAEQAIELASDATHTHPQASSATQQATLTADSKPSKDASSVPEHPDLASSSLSPIDSSPQAGVRQAATGGEQPCGKDHISKAETDIVEPVTTFRQRPRPQQPQNHFEQEKASTGCPIDRGNEAEHEDEVQWPKARDSYDSDAGSEAQPLIARPEGYLRVSVNQRPAKRHFDRSCILSPLQSQCRMQWAVYRQDLALTVAM